MPGITTWPGRTSRNRSPSIPSMPRPTTSRASSSTHAMTRRARSRLTPGRSRSTPRTPHPSTTAESTSPSKAGWKTRSRTSVNPLKATAKTPPSLPTGDRPTLRSAGSTPALADLAKAISLDPQSLNAYTNRARIHMMRREWAEAIKDCDAGLRITPSNDVLTGIQAEAKMKMR